MIFDAIVAKPAKAINSGETQGKTSRHWSKFGVKIIKKQSECLRRLRRETETASHSVDAKFT